MTLFVFEQAELSILRHQVFNGVEEVELNAAMPKPPETLTELQAEKVTGKLRILDAVVLLACRAQEADIEGIAAKHEAT